MTGRVQESAEIDRLTTELRALLQRGGLDSSDEREARFRLEELERLGGLLAQAVLPLVFIGPPEVGKSAIITLLTRLTMSSKRLAPDEGAVLVVGSGRSTAFEVEVCRARGDGQHDEIILEMKKVPDAELAQDIHCWARDLYRQRHGDLTVIGEDGALPTSEELAFVYRSLVGAALRKEHFERGNLKGPDWRWVDPLDELMDAASDEGAFATQMVERARLSERTDERWVFSQDEAGLTALRDLLAALNVGAVPTASVPDRVEIQIPWSPLEGSGGPQGIDLSFVDTRGLEGSLLGRGDLQRHLRKEDALFVLCMPFGAPPGSDVRGMLQGLAADSTYGDVSERMLLVITDKGDSAKVAQARGDRAQGRELKRRQCLQQLAHAGLRGQLREERLLVVNVMLEEDREELGAAVAELVEEIREGWRARSGAAVEDARDFARELHARSPEAQRLRAEVDLVLDQTLERNWPAEPPMLDPLEGLYRVFQETRYASPVLACCRRKGYYKQPDAYLAVASGARAAAVLWWRGPESAASQRLKELLEDPSYEIISSYVRLKRDELAKDKNSWIESYARGVAAEIQQALSSDPVWVACENRWGGGSGFKRDVISYLQEWSQRNTQLSGHYRYSRGLDFPKVRPAGPLTLRARKLRALVEVNWSPGSLAVLVGANGVGKSTLMDLLRFLEIAYRRDVAEALSEVYRGGANLRSWGASEEDAVELGVQLGDLRWSLALIPSQAGLAVSTEILQRGERVILRRDSMDGVAWREERFGAGSRLGLRLIADAGRRDPDVAEMAAFFERIQTLRDPDPWALRQAVSSADYSRLDFRGRNALALLHRWNQDLKDRTDRFGFVISTMRAAFPTVFQDLDFAPLNTSIAGRVYKPGRSNPGPLEDEANGVLQMLVVLTALAAADGGDLVAIDEPENNLHPFAIRRLVDAMVARAQQKDLTLLVATHSTVLLDRLKPHQIFVFEQDRETGQFPARSDRVADPDWLDSFTLGELFVQGKLGDNQKGP